MSLLSLDNSKKAAEALFEYVRGLEKNQESGKGKKKTIQLLTDYADEDHTLPLQPLDLVVTTKKFVSSEKKMEPIQVPISHSFLGKGASDSVPLSICLLVRELSDSSVDALEFYNKAIVETTSNEEDALEALQAEQKTEKNKKDTGASIPLKELAKIKIDKVVTFTQLRNEYRPFQARRQLISEHDIFFVDRALAEADEGLLIPKILGKTFFQRSKLIPQPVSLTPSSSSKDKKSVQLAIRNKDLNTKTKNGNSSDIKTRERALIQNIDADKIHTSFSLTTTLSEVYKRLNSTHFRLAPTTSIVVRVGSTALTPEEISENIDDVVEFVTDKKNNYIQNGWDAIRGIFLKTATGPSLPVYISETLYENEATDVVADESELVKPKNKKRKVSEAKITDKRIDELLTEIADEEDLERLKKKPATEKAVNGEKKAETEVKETEKVEAKADPKQEKKKAKTLAAANKSGKEKKSNSKK